MTGSARSAERQLPGTAIDLYFIGESEAAIGQWAKPHGDRSQVTLEQGADHPESGQRHVRPVWQTRLAGGLLL